MVFEQPSVQKEMFWGFEKSIFQFFASFWVTIVKLFPDKLKQSIQDYLNQNWVMGNFVENGCKATFSSKTNVLSIWAKHFSVFCKLLSDIVEAVFWECEAKC